MTTSKVQLTCNPDDTMELVLLDEADMTQQALTDIEVAEVALHRAVQRLEYELARQGNRQPVKLQPNHFWSTYYAAALNRSNMSRVS